MNETTTIAAPFLRGGGDAGALIRAYNWTATPLEPPEDWPQSLVTLVGIMLDARQPMFVAWGPSRTMIYNDAYAEVLGTKHPDALGNSFDTVWAEAMVELAPLLETVFVAGDAIHMDDITLHIDRAGRPREAHFDFSYNPVRDAFGTVAGLFCACRETTQEVDAERQRMAEVDRQRRLFEEAPGFIAIWRGPEHVYEFANRAHQSMFGNRDVIGKTIREAFPDTADQGFHALLDEVYASHERFVGRGIPVSLEDDAGVRTQYLDFVYAPVRGDDGQVTGIFCEGYDVTDQHIAREELSRSEARFRAAIDALHGVLWTNTPEGEMRGEQPAWAALTGQSFDAYQGYGWVSAIHPDDAQPTIDAWNLAVAERRPFALEHRVRRADGVWRTFAVRAVPTFSEDGSIREWIGVHTDITRERSVQAALRDSEAQFRGVAEALPGFVWTAGPDGSIDYTSPRWQDYSGSDATGNDLGWSKFVHRDDSEAARLRWAASVASGDPYETEFRLRDRHGAYHWWLARAQRTMDEGKVRWVGTSTELDEIVAARETLSRSRNELEREIETRTAALRATEEQLRQSQKLEAIGQLTGGVAHDFNNLLTVIRGSVDLMRRPGLTEERRERYVEAISTTVDRAAKLTGQLLAFARRQALQPESFDVGTALRATYDMLRTLVGARVRVEIDLPTVALHIDADPAQFDTAIVNMAANARDAMAGEGKLTISVAQADGIPDVRLHPRIAGRFVAISMTDEGSGIAADQIDAIFEPFYTTKGVGQGTGLGLSQVYGFAKQSGGEIRVTSTLGQGSIFTLFLPRVDMPAMSAVAARPTGIVNGDGGCVLVVEDDTDVGSFAKHALAELGYRTSFARDARTALRMIADADGEFDMVFSDVVMPGMTGIELARAVRTRHPDLPIVLTSGYSDTLAAEGSSGFNLLHKPYSLETLSQALSAARR